MISAGRILERRSLVAVTRTSELQRRRLVPNAPAAMEVQRSARPRRVIDGACLTQAPCSAKYKLVDDDQTVDEDERNCQLVSYLMLRNL